MVRCRPIGVFDSGVGGFTVVREICRQMPGEEILYFADTAHVPYGPRPADELIRFAIDITGFLVAQGAKMILVACNTSSSLALDVLQERFPVPIVGVVQPGAEEAVRQTRNGRVGVLATEATIRKGAHAAKIRELSNEIEVFGQACPRFVPLVESGCFAGPEAYAAAKEYVTPLIDAGVDTIIFGCTHYPFLEPVIRSITGDQITLVDPACQTVARGQAILQKLRLTCRDPYGKALHHRFYVSGDRDDFYASGRALLDPDLLEDVRPVVLDQWQEKEAESASA
ncbi:glutamate racemase [Heliophilum fasciatum]|uniref:Glutamate racemase n=1 Tax=Heliophilum fasciatum TaxID=35700 RepID=A0A4R2RV24_9FIRM|nr:glutamate racemase [Heliophilum fasciatum]